MAAFARPPVAVRSVEDEGEEVPARASHLPTNAERDALQRLRVSGELTLKAIGPTTHRTVLKMIAKGWIEHGSDDRTYRITPDGEAALRAKMPLR